MKNGLIVDWHGNKVWYLNDELHRVDGPAMEVANGSKLWYLNGNLHRVDGPAVEYANGAKHWFLNCKELIHPEEFSTMEEWFQHLNNNEEYSYQFINDIEGLIEIIKNPTSKQKRLHQMRWVL